MSETIESSIWAQLVLDEAGQLTISEDGCRHIKATVSAAVGAGDVRAVADGLVTVGFLATQDNAKPAVAILRRIAKEFEAATMPMFLKVESANSQKNEAMKKRLQQVVGAETNGRTKAAVFGAPVPKGAVSVRDLAPPRDPRRMR